MGNVSGITTEDYDELEKKTSDYWGTQQAWNADSSLQWLQLEVVERRLAAKVSGNPTINWLQYVIDRYYAHRLPVGCCLSLGCGEGFLERKLASLNFFAHCDAYDIAEESINRARRAASNQGLNHISYKAANIDKLQLPAAHYDAIFVHSALHHFSNLEGVYAQIHKALKSEALFICNEYIGPSRFQFPRQQVEAMNMALALLPIQYRRMGGSGVVVDEDLGNNQPQINKVAQTGKRFKHLAQRGVTKIREGVLWPTARRKLRETLFSRFKSPDGARYKLEVACPTVNDVIIVDPSEAVRSEEILPLMRKEFEILEIKGYGGSLLQFLLAGIANNFVSDDPVARSLLQMLFQIEDSLIAAGELQHDFAVIVARKH